MTRALPGRRHDRNDLSKKAGRDFVKLQSPLPHYLVSMLQRTLSAGFIAPCLPTKTTQLPSGSQWLHEIKHDGFRIIARKSDGKVRL
jgi:ATP-dependent DNA ligase